MPESMDEYLDATGAIELLCEIPPGGARFEDLVDELPISRPTVSQRLIEGRELSLFERKPVSTEHGTTHKHILSLEGAALRTLLDDHGVTYAYLALKTARKQFHLETQEFRDAYSSLEAEVADSRQNEFRRYEFRQREYDEPDDYRP